MNKTIFYLEGVNLLQIIRLSGVIELYELEKDKIEIETKHNFILLKGRYKIKRDIFMIAKEIKNDNTQEKKE